MHRPELTDEQKNRLADMATGFALGFEKAQQEFGLDAEVLEDVLLDMNIEKCPDCGWFVDSHELIGPDGDEPDGHCRNCRPGSAD